MHDVAQAEMALRMSTDAGKASLDKHGKLPGVEHKMWVNPEGTANVASLGDLSDQYHVYFNNAEEDVFVVREWDDTDGSNAVKFPRNHVSNLHSYKFGKEFLTQPRSEVEGQAQLVSTVAKN